MKLTLEALQVLDAIGRRGSFAAAADELGRVPSALSYQVQRLEHDLDVLVFDRRGHRAKLTPAGEELLREGRLLLEAAADLQHRVRQVANGWEAEIRIAVDAIVPVALLHPLLARFFDDCGRLGGAAPRTATRVRIEAEALGGTWESVIAGRVDLAVGASGDPPPGANLRTRPLGTIEEVFVVAAGHPLATAAEPLPPVAIARHRAVAVADSARSTPPRTLGLLPSQDTLTVPDIGTKLDALLAGLGCGYLPRYVVIPALGDSRLVEKRIAEPKPEATLALAWRARRPGRALTWWLDALSQPQDWGGRVFARRNA